LGLVPRRSELAAALIAWCRKGYSLREAADRFGISKEEARKVRDRAIVAYYKSGHSMPKVAARFRVTINTVYRVLQRDCPKAIRPNSRCRLLSKQERETRDCDIVEHYRTGNSTKQTAAHFGLKSHHSVLDILWRDAPEHVRPPGEYWRGPVPADVEFEYQMTIARRRAHEDADIEKAWPEKEAFGAARNAGFAR
jgi:transposase